MVPNLLYSQEVIDGSFHNDLAVVKKENKYGIINTNGSFIIGPEYELIIYDKIDQLYLIYQAGTISLLDKNLNTFSDHVFSGSSSDIKFRFHHYKFSNELMAVKVDSLYGYLDKKGDFAITPNYKFARKFKDGYAIVGLDRYGLIDKQGQVILPEEYDDVKVEYDRYIIAFKDGFSKVLQGGVVLADSIRGSVKEISKNHLLILRYDSKMQLLKSDGESSLRENYDEIEFQMFAPGVTFRNGSTWGYYDLESEKLIVPQEYEEIKAYYGGHTIIVKSEGKYGLINKEGEVIQKPIYDEVKATTDGVLIIQDGKYGLFDKKGNEIFPLIYDSIDYVGNFKYKVVRKGKSQIIKYKEK
ncbi:hypothetical protein BFP72_10930 [Reichenbachiella sp. 5M10]|uniref:WG repeat-containing protein n=1 Tax=Reichenbachiella sp. 5M10 TaxID=1889772 RepID=UPI000C15065E|nr:WG repeat-containing protein [Reichenbachiella sp. 5M10]PIB35871.1 hypothetical protein BFP72_10930 [Reichenbachiella sp. 5M10]